MSDPPQNKKGISLSTQILTGLILGLMVATLLLTFWILPGLTAALTPFSYRDILTSARDALTTGFVTGNLFITLPMLVENARTFVEDRRIKNEDTDNFAEVLVPTSFNFPNIGKLLTFSFINDKGDLVGLDVELWILGEAVEQKKRRWSMGRDLFGLWE